MCCIAKGEETVKVSARTSMPDFAQHPLRGRALTDLPCSFSQRFAEDVRRILGNREDMGRGAVKSRGGSGGARARSASIETEQNVSIEETFAKDLDSAAANLRDEEPGAELDGGLANLHRQSQEQQCALDSLSYLRAGEEMCQGKDKRYETAERVGIERGTSGAEVRHVSRKPPLAEKSKAAACVASLASYAGPCSEKSQGQGKITALSRSGASHAHTARHRIGWDGFELHRDFPECENLDGNAAIDDDDSDAVIVEESVDASITMAPARQGEGAGMRGRSGGAARSKRAWCSAAVAKGQPIQKRQRQARLPAEACRKSPPLHHAPTAGPGGGLRHNDISTAFSNPRLGSTSINGDAYLHPALTATLNSGESEIGAGQCWSVVMVDGDGQGAGHGNLWSPRLEYARLLKQTQTNPSVWQVHWWRPLPPRTIDEWHHLPFTAAHSLLYSMLPHVACPCASLAEGSERGSRVLP